MCGTLARENVVSKLGSILPISSSNGEVFSGYWNNHARSETLEKWTSQGWKEGKLEVSSYTEGKGSKEKVFFIPQDKAIKIIYHSERFLHAANPFCVVTRESSTSEEKAVHDRFPVLVDK